MNKMKRILTNKTTSIVMLAVTACGVYAACNCPDLIGYDSYFVCGTIGEPPIGTICREERYTPAVEICDNLSTNSCFECYPTGGTPQVVVVTPYAGVGSPNDCDDCRANLVPSGSPFTKTFDGPYNTDTMCGEDS